MNRAAFIILLITLLLLVYTYVQMDIVKIVDLVFKFKIILTAMSIVTDIAMTMPNIVEKIVLQLIDTVYPYIGIFERFISTDMCRILLSLAIVFVASVAAGIGYTRIEHRIHEAVMLEHTPTPTAPPHASQPTEASMEILEVIPTTRTFRCGEEEVTISSRLGKFVLEACIGAGSYAYVFRARDDVGKQYAIKVLRYDLVKQSLDVVDSIINEFKKVVAVKDPSRRISASKLLEVSNLCGNEIAEWCRSRADVLARELDRHRVRNIVSVYTLYASGSIGNERDYYRDPTYVAMDYADSGTLIDIIKNDAKYKELVSKPSLLRKLILSIVGAIAAYHVVTDGKEIHRDIKPDNVLLKRVGEEFEPMLTDFGIAARIGREELWNRGTPLYMPVEHLLYPGFGNAPDYDVYSLGITIYELLVREPPLQQYLAIAVSRHPLIPSEVRANARSVVETFEIALMGVAGMALRSFESIVYPPDLEIPTTSVSDDVIRSLIPRYLEKLKEVEDAFEHHTVLASIRKYDRDRLAKRVNELLLPGELVDIIMRAISVSPDRRYRNALCMWLELRRILSS